MTVAWSNVFAKCKEYCSIFYNANVYVVSLKGVLAPYLTSHLSCCLCLYHFIFVLCGGPCLRPHCHQNFDVQ